MKRIFSLGLIFVMVLSLFATSFASSHTDWIVEEVERTNEKIEQMIDNAQRETNREIEKFNLEVAVYELLREISNAPVDKLIEDAEQRLDKSMDKIIDNLVRDTDEEAAKMIEKAAGYGIEVICEYVEVEIGGRTVWIDPLRIIEW